MTRAYEQPDLTPIGRLRAHRCRSRSTTRKSRLRARPHAWSSSPSTVAPHNRVYNKSPYLCRRNSAPPALGSQSRQIATAMPRSPIRSGTTVGASARWVRGSPARCGPRLTPRTDIARMIRILCQVETHDSHTRERHGHRRCQPPLSCPPYRLLFRRFDRRRGGARRTHDRVRRNRPRPR